MKISRNDPCPCGSGKKYKKCCLHKDQKELRCRHEEEQRRLAEIEEEVEASERPYDEDFDNQEEESKLPDPVRKAQEECWEKFEGEDYEGKIESFQKLLRQTDILDHDIAFSMLETLFSETLNRNERERFNLLLETFYNKQRRTYLKGAQFYLDWQIINALAAGQKECIPELMDRMASITHKSIDQFNQIKDCLAYHGFTSVLASCMYLAWPRVKKSKDIVSWGIDDFASDAVDYAMFECLEKTSSWDAKKTELVEKVAYYYDEVNHTWLTRYLRHITGKGDIDWNMELFEVGPPRGKSRRKKKTDEWKDHLYHLTVEFLGYLKREKNIPYSKGELARASIYSYIVSRDEGELQGGRGMFDVPRKRRAKPKAPAHLLCPDGASFDRYLASKLDFLSAQIYDAVATLELIPEWLYFLELQQLLDPKVRETVFQQILYLDRNLLDILKNFPEYPELVEVMKNWRTNLTQD